MIDMMRAVDSARDILYTANPSDNGTDWIVWNMYEWPPAPVFAGTMEECGAVVDCLNSPGSPER